jgi:ferrous iron transport protein B
MTVDKGKIRIALAGNPNSGKTSIFNELTGMSQYVGNWPGVTIEKFVGHRKTGDYDLEITDLPGTYSLSPYSPDERVARDFLLFERPDVVCVVVDASNLERNLYLVAQIVELDLPIVVALNMIDIAKGRGITINIDKLSALVGAPVVPTVARSGVGIEELISSIVDVSQKDYCPVPLNYGKVAERAITEIENTISAAPPLAMKCHTSRYLAASLVANDAEITSMILTAEPNAENIRKAVGKIRLKMETRLGLDGESMLANMRHGWASGIYHEVVDHPRHDEPTTTDHIDDVLLNRFVGIPIFSGIMFLIFWATFTLGAYPMDWIDSLFGAISGSLENLMASSGFSETLISMVVDGAIAGVGGVLIFLPNIIILFFFVSILEDSGYMARAAFLMDKVMHKFGLHGKSFIPIIIGFGCTVPAVMSTRTLENREDRLLTILILPFVLCSARVPVFVLFTSALFESNQGLVLFSMYFLSIAISIIAAKALKIILFKGLSTPFVMELPPYHVPALKGILLHTWERAYAFVKKAGTVILVGSIVIWALGSLPPGAEYASAESLAGRIGAFFEPIVRVFGTDWRGAVSLIFGFVAKEIVVATLAVLASSGNDANLANALGSIYTPLSAYAFMVFTLVYTPCIATIAAIKKETGSWKWALFSIAFNTGLAWILATIVYRGGRLIGLG